MLNGLAKEPTVECAEYNKLIRDLGGIDLQLLGMGHNGHIAFNAGRRRLRSGDPSGQSDREHHRGQQALL